MPSKTPSKNHGKINHDHVKTSFLDLVICTIPLLLPNPHFLVGKKKRFLAARILPTSSHNASFLQAFF
jgi:hypothetical protein